MLNKLIQGSAADILKFALLEAYQAGVFDILTMHLTVHDENVVSVPFNKIGTEAVTELKRIMDMSFHSKLNVPMKAACELGPNWGYWSGDIYAEMLKGNFDPAFFKKDYRETH
jgi:DNA polymerase I-like protein with 3'-5' exonuclease and polymerase domains